MRLGEHLTTLGLVPPEAVRQALEMQQLHGGRLGTLLVQQGALTLDALAAALGELLMVPVASERQLEAAPLPLLARVSDKVAASCCAVPVAERGQQLLVAMIAPLDRQLVATLEEETRSPIVPCVAPELRVWYWLEKHYGVARPKTFLRTEPGQAGPDRTPRRVIAPAPAPLPSETKALGRIAIVKRAAPAAPARAPDDDLGLDITIDNRRRSTAAEQALEDISFATSSNDVADALCEFLAGSVDCGLLFMVRGPVAVGWRAAHEHDAAALETLAVPLELPTAFRAACEHGVTYRGQPPAAGAEWHQRLAGTLGRALPRDLLIAPVVGEAGVLALIYAQMADDKPLPAQVVSDLDALTEAVTRWALARAQT